MYNPNFYNNFQGNNFTFQPTNVLVPPPPPPPPFFIPPRPLVSLESTDNEFIKHFESKISSNAKKCHKSTVSISQIREQLHTLISSLNKIKVEENRLSQNINTFTEDEWNNKFEAIQKDKSKIDETLAQINDTYLDVLCKLVAKRSAKRLRLKRARLEQKRDKEKRRKELEERSRKIDENLQKIKDDINKAKQEKESKLQADIVLKEVLRKKHDAKKCVLKLDALIKLHKARQNTAKGRGDSVSERDAESFYSNIDKLKFLWVQKLATYENEEMELRTKLKQDTKDVNTALQETEIEVKQNLVDWCQVLFGGTMPQQDFNGDVGRFVAIRSKWDRFISNEGSSIPVGWVPPLLKP